MRAGAQAVARFLREQVGLPASSFRVTDGSGLSLLDEATPRSLVQLLAWTRHSSEGRAFYQSLPVVGEGIRSRMLGTAAEGRLRAKTGTLNNVSALSGYVKVKFQAESPDASPAREVMQRFGAVGLPTYVILKPR